MKMNKKGFTLIELLAVIVILAIIALIATPIIMGIIDDAKKKAAENSAYGYIKSVENTMVQKSFSQNDIVTLNGDYTISADGKTITCTACTAPNNAAIPISFNGEAPKKIGNDTDAGTLKYTNGVLQAGSVISINGYKFHTTDTSGKLTEGPVGE